MNCRYCNHVCIKKGWAGTTQRYRCKSCGKYQQLNYVYSRSFDSKLFVLLNNESVSVNGMARILGVSRTTVLRNLVKYRILNAPPVEETGEEYEIDELFTYVGKKEPSNYCCVISAINRRTGKLVAAAVGKRTNEVMSVVVDKVLQLQSKMIHTDGCSNYLGLIPKAFHRVSKSFLYRIERFHLTLRTRLKRLCRDTICFSRSEAMLEASVKLFLWG